MRVCRTLAGLALLAPVLPAQVAATDSARLDSLRRLRSVRLDAVTVTAAGPLLPLARVPYAVSARAVPGAARMTPPLALDEALRGIPGVQVDNRRNLALGERLTIRGFGARTQFGVRGVRVDVDDVPATMPDGQTTLTHIDPAYLGGVEVLRGPASAMYGNAAGGVVRLRSSPAAAARTAGRVGGLFGEGGTTVGRASLSGRTGDWSALAHGSRLRYDGFRRHSAADDRRVGTRLTRATTTDTMALVIATADYEAESPGALTDSQRTADPRAASATNLRFRTGETGRHRQAGASWRRVFASGLATASAYGLARRVDSPIPQRIIDLGRRAGGVRLAGAWFPGFLTSGSELSLGAEHASQHDDRRSYANLDGTRGALALDQRERVRNTGVFGRASLPVGPWVHVLAALRSDDVRFTVEDHLVAPDADDSGTRRMRAMSPSVGVSILRWPGSSLYANVATAFETPTSTELANQVSGAGGLNPELGPQRVISIEAGGRSQLGGVATASLAVFDARVRDALVPFEVPSSPGRQFFRNVARARHRGVEADVAVAIGARVSATVAITLLDAKFVSDIPGRRTLASRRIPGVAPARVETGVHIGPVAASVLELALRAQSRTPVTDANDAWSPGYAVADARLHQAARRIGALSVTPTIAIENLFGVRYDAAVVANAARGRYFEPAPGRRVTVGLDAGFARAGR